MLYIYIYIILSDIIYLRLFISQRGIHERKLGDESKSAIEREKERQWDDDKSVEEEPNREQIDSKLVLGCGQETDRSIQNVR